MIRDVVSTIIFSATTSGLVIGLSKEWISARLKARIEHEYDKKLETHKAELKAEQELAILNIKTELASEAAFHAAAHASFSAGQKASIERKLNAVDRLWTFIVQFRSNLPGVLTFVDLLTVDEYRAAKEDPTFRELSSDLSPENLAKMSSSSIEDVRPFVGEYLWAVFFSYRAILLRILFMLHLGRTDAEKIEWYKDDATRRLIKAVLTAPGELQEFEQTQFGKVSWLQRRLESKILAAAQKVISGETFGTESLEQAQLIQQRIAQLSSKEQGAKG
jgi:hypothetical protein